MVRIVAKKMTASLFPEAPAPKPARGPKRSPAPVSAAPAAAAPPLPNRSGLRILALDPATHCGWAHSCGASGTWDLSVKRDESSGMRLIRLQGKLNEIRDSVGVDIVFFEAQLGGNPKRMGALVVQSEIQGVIKLWLTQNKIDYKGISPTELKKFATGKGSGKKELMCAAAKEKWPDIFPMPVKDMDDNRADALWMLEFAKKQLS